jgi:ferrous iron transport protein B
VGLWTTGVAYFTATLFYQAATFGRDPGSAGLWIAGSLLVFVVTLSALRLWAGNGRDRTGLTEVG